jgi:hypothetical protein
MLPTQIDLDQAHDRYELHATEALREQLASTRELPTRAVSIRRAIGHRFIALGRRIAAEPATRATTMRA